MSNSDHKKLTAKQRTIPMFDGPMMAPQDDRSPIDETKIIDGPVVHRFVAFRHGFGSARHLVRPYANLTLCGYELKTERFPGAVPDCQMCRVEAARVRARIA